MWWKYFPVAQMYSREHHCCARHLKWPQRTKNVLLRLWLKRLLSKIGQSSTQFETNFWKLHEEGRKEERASRRKLVSTCFVTGKPSEAQSKRVAHSCNCAGAHLHCQSVSSIQTCRFQLTGSHKWPSR